MPQTQAPLLDHNIAQCTACFTELSALQQPLMQAAAIVRDAMLAGQRLLLAGNGGSFADAIHLATEFVCRYQHDRPPFAAQVLGEPSTICAIGNDYAFEDIFARQVEAFGRRGDVLIVFSSTGNSENIIRSLRAAAEHGIDSIAFLGRDGGACAGLATVELTVDHPLTARVQEAHQLLYHTLCEMIEPALGARP